MRRCMVLVWRGTVIPLALSPSEANRVGQARAGKDERDNWLPPWAENLQRFDHGMFVVEADAAGTVSTSRVNGHDLFDLAVSLSMPYSRGPKWIALFDRTPIRPECT